jgi:predicted GIY-YIG superfamily endonuclease
MIARTAIVKPQYPVSIGLLVGDWFAVASAMGKAKCVVYVLRSVVAPDRYYTGVTSDVHARLDNHNAGRCPHTADGRPWQLDLFIKFADEARALKFEHYLKSGSGCAFAKRHLRRARQSAPGTPTG